MKSAAPTTIQGRAYAFHGTARLYAARGAFSGIAFRPKSFCNRPVQHQPRRCQQMKRFRSATVAAAALALVSTMAIAAEPAAAPQPQELQKVAAAASKAAVLPGLPLSLSAAFQAVAMTAAPEPVAVAPASTKRMQIAE